MQSEMNKNLVSLPSLQNIITLKFYCGGSLQTFNTPTGERNIQTRQFKNLNHTGTQLNTGENIKIIFQYQLKINCTYNFLYSLKRL